MAGVSKKPETARQRRIKLLEKEVLCELAVPRSANGTPKGKTNPQACRDCESPCEYGAEWLRLLAEEDAARDAAEEETAPKEKKPAPKPEAARKPKEPEKPTVQETMTADLQEARIEELQKELEKATAGTRELEKELKKTRDALASADGVAARAETARKNAGKRVEVLLEEREKLTKEAEEARALLEVVTGERDEAERERQAAERKRGELREIAEREHMARMAAEEMCTRLKAMLWDMEHPTAQA